MDQLIEIAKRYEVDAPGMPIRLGSALRVPSYAYPNWSIVGDESLLFEASEREYESEWKDGSAAQISYIQEAAKRAGNPGNLPMLRNACADVVSKLAQRIKGKINIMDVGAGLSAIVMCEKLGEEEKQRVHLFLLEPSKTRLYQTAEKLETMGFERGKNLTLAAAKDLEMMRYVEPGSMDIITGVASVHHHSFLSFDVFYKALKPSGFLVLADLHNHLFEHPNRIYYKFLDQLEWETKDKDLEMFVKKFPKALETAPPLTRLQQNADDIIIRNRMEWAKIRMSAIARGEFSEENDIHLLEAHVPVEKYIEEFLRCGFSIDGGILRDVMPSNPMQLLPEASLLMVTVGIK